jgi:hypothetical protein
MQGNLRSINLQHSFEVETFDREKLAVGECILDHSGNDIWTCTGCSTSSELAVTPVILMGADRSHIDNQSL